MKRMEQIKQFLKKRWSVIWLITAIVCAVFMFAYAEYDSNNNRIKRVAANVSSGGQLFSSNYLEKDSPVQLVPFSSGTNNYCTISVKIYNYSQSNPSKPYQNALPYTLTATIVKREVSGDSITYTPVTANPPAITMTIGDNTSSFTQNSTGDPYIITDNYTFSAGTSDVHIYSLNFPDSMLANNNDIYVKLEAQPTNGDINLSPISAYFSIKQKDTALAQGWEGHFSDDKSKKDYDAFNYVFTGNGAETITFKWCTNYLEVSQVSLNEYGLTASSSTENINSISGTWKTVTIDADANTGPNRYDFQLYMTGDPANDYGSGDTFWTNVEKYISTSLPDSET